MCNWWVMYMERTFLLQHPNLLSEIMMSILYSSTILSMASCSLLKFFRASGIDFNNLKT